MKYPANRRTDYREHMTLPHGLTISAFGEPGKPRQLAAIVVDASDNGLGIEMSVPLVAGSTVGFRGDFHGRGLSIGLEGRARVAHCTSSVNGLFRVGLAFSDVSYRLLAA